MKRLFFLLLLALMVGCGGGGGGGGTTGTGGGGGTPGTGGGTTGSGDATITGTVAGTTFVAVEAASGAVAARQAAVSQNSSKVFTITVQSGKQYKFYLVENEGTDSERVFPLYIGGNNKFDVSAGTCNLGFVSTASGNAVPANTPAQFSGAGEDTTVPSGVATNQASLYSQSDLTGVWYIFTFNVGTYTGWSRATYTVTATGEASTTNMVTSDNSNPQTRSQTLKIAASGVISTASGPFEKAVMAKSKDLIVGVGNNNDGQSSAMGIAVKAGSGFTQSDLAGTWRLHGLTASNTERGWIRSDVSIAAGGTPSMSNQQYGNSKLKSFGTGTPVTIDPTGLFSSGMGAVTRDKNLIVMVVNNEDGSVSLALVVRTGVTTFSQADLMGDWRNNVLMLTATDAYWYRDLTVINANAIVSTNRISNGNLTQDTISSTVPVMNGQGIISNAKSEYIMTPNKKMIVYTETNTTSGSSPQDRLGIFVK